MNKRIFLLLVGYAVFAVILGLRVYSVYVPAVDYSQGDFRRNYYAGKFALEGHNPYDWEKMAKRSGNNQPFVYPPYAIFIFKILAMLGPTEACWLFFGIKLFIYLSLIFLWKKYFFTGSQTILFPLFFALSIFSEGVYIDFDVGNIVVIEQLFFWVGIIFFLKDKIIPSGVCILLASSFKFLNTPFLLLFLVDGAIWQFFLFVGILISAVLLSWAINSAYWIQFLQHNISFIVNEDFGHKSVSTRSFFIDLSRRFPLIDGTFFYLVLVLLILLISAFVVIKKSKLLKSNKEILVYFFIITYCLVTPRLNDYAQIILMVPAYFLLDYYYRMKKYGMLTFLIFLYFILSPHLFYFPSRNIRDLTLHSPSLWPVILRIFPDKLYKFALIYINNYHILFTTFILWVIFVWFIYKGRTSERSRGMWNR